MRPIHCTDLKRETVYVKYEDNWNNDYLKIALNSLGGQTEEEEEKYIKIHKKNY